MPTAGRARTSSTRSTTGSMARSSAISSTARSTSASATAPMSPASWRRARSSARISMGRMPGRTPWHSMRTRSRRPGTKRMRAGENLGEGYEHAHKIDAPGNQADRTRVLYNSFTHREVSDLFDGDAGPFFRQQTEKQAKKQCAHLRAQYGRNCGLPALTGCRRGTSNRPAGPRHIARRRPSVGARPPCPRGPCCARRDSHALCARGRRIEGQWRRLSRPPISALPRLSPTAGAARSTACAPSPSSR